MHLEQLASYGDPGRDPRMRVVTVAYLAPGPVAADAAGGQRRRRGRLGAGRRPARRVGRGGKGGGEGEAGEGLAFDHDRILADGLERARAKLEYTPLATAFCPPEFTVAQLRRVYEIVWGVALDPRNFHRKITGTPGFLRPAARHHGRRPRPPGPALPARRRHRPPAPDAPRHGHLTATPTPPWPYHQPAPWLSELDG